MIYFLVPMGVVALILFIPWTRHLVVKLLLHSFDHVYEHHMDGVESFAIVLGCLGWTAIAASAFVAVYLLYRSLT